MKQKVEKSVTNFILKMFIQGWELRFAVLAFGRMRQEDCEFQTRLGYYKKTPSPKHSFDLHSSTSKSLHWKGTLWCFIRCTYWGQGTLVLFFVPLPFLSLPASWCHSPASHCCWKADIASLVQKEKRAVYCWWFLSVASIRPFNQVTEEENYSFVSLIVIVCYPSTSLIRW